MRFGDDQLAAVRTSSPAAGSLRRLVSLGTVSLLAASAIGISACSNPATQAPSAAPPAAASSTTSTSTTSTSTTSTSTTSTSTTVVVSEPGTLRAFADERGVHIGAAVLADPLLGEPDYAAVLAREFNVLTAEDEMKWDAVHPKRDVYDFEAADAIVDFAEAHGMRVRGHTLVWYQANPAWLEGGNFTRDEAIEILRDHITTVVGRYRGRIFQWDVVNEALPEGDGGGLRDNVWRRLIGDDYLELAFQFAHAADPNAKLYYNDYDWALTGPKAAQIVDLAAKLQAAGAPIDGVGFQFHALVRPDRKAVEALLQSAADLGLSVAITEVDNGRPTPLDDAALADQAATYADLLAACLAVVGCDTFVMWGFTDRHSWIPDAIPGFGSPLIFDSNLQPKPAYDALVAVLAPRP